MKPSETTLTYLQSLTLSSSTEKAFLDETLRQLKEKQNETRVLAELRSNLTLLAVKQQISKEGLDLLTALQKPNFENDLSRTFNLWI